MLKICKRKRIDSPGGQKFEGRTGQTEEKRPKGMKKTSGSRYQGAARGVRKTLMSEGCKETAKVKRKSFKP